MMASLEGFPSRVSQFTWTIVRSLAFLVHALISCFRLLVICRVRRAFLSLISMADLQSGWVFLSSQYFSAHFAFSNFWAVLPKKFLLIVKAEHCRVSVECFMCLPVPGHSAVATLGAVSNTGHQEEGKVSLCGTFPHHSAHCQTTSNYMVIPVLPS